MTSLAGAVCATLPENEKAWFFSDEKRNGGSTYRKAQAVCRRCPVMKECLDLAMEMEGGGVGVFEGARFGVWGSFSGKQRARLAKEIANKSESA